MDKITENNIQRINLFANNLKTKGFYRNSMELNKNIRKDRYKSEWLDKLKLGNNLLKNIFTFEQEWDMERYTTPVVFEDGIDWKYIPNDDPEWMYMLNRHRFFTILAECYLYSNNDQYLYKLKEIWQHWIKTERNIESNYSSTWRTIDTGIRLKYWIKTCNLLVQKDSLINILGIDLTIDILDSIDEQLDYLMSDENLKRSLISNWKVLEMNGVFISSLYVNHFKYVNKAADILEQVIDMQICKDGFHWEQSFMYHHEVLICLLEVVELSNRNNIVVSSRILNALESMVRSTIALTRPNCTQSAYGDSDVESLKSLLSWIGLVLENENAVWLTQNTCYLSNLFDYGEEAEDKLLTIKAIKPEQLSYKFEDVGLVFLRDSWESDGIFTLFKNGPQGGGHGHSDLLHIEIHAGNETLLTDSGRYTYIEDSDERQYFKRASSHNTTLIDGKEFTIQSGSWGYNGVATSLPIFSRFGTNVDYIETSHIGYLFLGKQVVVTRKLIYIKPDIWIISDEFLTLENYNYFQIFNFPNKHLELVTDYFKYTGFKHDLYIKPLNTDQFDIQNSYYSPNYNDKIKSKRLILSKKGNKHQFMITVLSLNEKVDVSEEIISSSGQFLDKNIAEGICVTLNNRSYLVGINHQEDRTLLSRKSYKIREFEYYGRVCVIDLNDGKPNVLKY